MIDRKNISRGLALLGLAGLTMVPFYVASSPISRAESPSVPEKQKFPKGEMFDRVMDLIGKQRLNYQSLQARIDFVQDLASYRKVEGVNPPCSMVLSTDDKSSRLQIAHCDVFSGEETFQFMASLDNNSVEATICAPSTPSKRYGYGNLTNSFQQGEVASRAVLMYLAGGGSPDCSYFRGESENHRRNAPTTGKPRG